MLQKKAAMFGLDARIALAIFGALSIITGAALYNTLENIHAVTLINEMKEVGKAWEQYYLDTGKSIPRAGTDSNHYNYHRLQTKYLVENTANLKGWKGPYLQYEVHTDFLKHPIHQKVHMTILNDKPIWTGIEGCLWDDGKCLANDQCFLWVYINGFDDDVLAKQIDKKIDNGNGPSKGIFRWDNWGDPTYKYYYFLQVTAINKDSL